MFYRKQFDTIIANKSEHAALTKSAIIHPIKDHHSNRKMYAKKKPKRDGFYTKYALLTF